MQGYVIGRPMPASEIVAWIEAFEPDPLWKLSGSQRPSREYFELLLAQTNHRHWIAQQLESLAEAGEPYDPEPLQDPGQCRFGHWYYADGMRLFESEPWFRALESAHLGVHQTAARLCGLRRSGNQTLAARVEVELLLLQEELDGLLRSTREGLADKYLTVERIMGQGE